MASLEDLIPGGIKPTDKWHVGHDDETCSRCGEVPPDTDVCLLLFADHRDALLRICQGCEGTRPDHIEENFYDD
ncbi:hypothetical protein [Roseobacter sp. S98]|uniref:hypothetical protein n=1 Tax=Roseobacter algicola (ex Choi et al. 2025) (nom. illeg.) TaxID=3092138 RepID=UPI003F50E2CC